MHAAWRWLLLPTLLAATVVIAGAVLALEGAPAVPARAVASSAVSAGEADDVTHEDVARVVQILKRHDPRRWPPGGLRAVQLGARDVELLLNHAGRRIVRARSSVAFENGAARVVASAPLPANLWLNLDMRWAEQPGGRPRLQSLTVGSLPLPAWAGEALFRWGIGRRGMAAEFDLAVGMVERVRFRPDMLTVVYRWDERAPGRVIGTLVPREDLPRLRAHVEALAAVAREHPLFETLPLSRALAPLVALARQRSEAGEDAAQELRAATIVLTAYANRRSLAQWLPDARDWPDPPRLRVTLDGREDLARHFLVSALLAIDGTSPLARAVGLYKEVADARGGSGFSFNDLAADRAGTRFGELALEQPRELLRRLHESPVGAVAATSGAGDLALMPAWRDLPESLPEAEFLRRFGGVGAPAYQAVVAEIDRRIGALPLLR